MVRPLPFDLENLLPGLVEEKLVVETLGRGAAERPADRARELDRVDQVLAGHFVIDAEGYPAHRPIGLPLQLAAPAGDGRRHPLAGLGIVVGDRARRDIARDDRDLQHDAGARAHRQKRRIGLRALLAQRRQHDGHHLVEAFEHFEERRVEAAREIAVRRGQELVVEAERVEKGAQPRIVVLAETRMRAERIGHLRQRLAEMARHHLPLGDVVGNFAQPVHVVGKGDQPRLHLVFGEHAERMPHHRGARDLAEGADMRQAGRSISGLENNLFLGALLQSRDDLASFLERPCVRLLGDLAQGARRILDLSRRHDHLACRYPSDPVSWRVVR